MLKDQRDNDLSCLFPKGNENYKQTKKSKKRVIKLKQRQIMNKYCLNQEITSKLYQFLYYYRVVMKKIHLKQIIQKRIEQDILESQNSLSQEVNKFHQRRILGFQRIQTLIQLYHCPIKLFGSCANGITIKDSDIDIAISNSFLLNFQFTQDPTLNLCYALQFLQQLFEQTPWVIESKFIKGAKVPLIKLIIDTDIPVSEDYIHIDTRQQLNRKIENGGLINIDLTIETNNHLGIISTEAIKKWLQWIPTLRTIIVFLKSHLAINNLNENYNRGLNTYSLIIMIVAYIYHAQLTKQTNVYLVLHKVLKFYGWEFDEKKKRIDIRNKKNIYQKKKVKTKCAQLQICDPLNEGNIMTKNCYRFSEIKELFRNIYNKCISATQNEIQQIYEKNCQLSEEELKALIEEEFSENYFIRELKN